MDDCKTAMLALPLADAVKDDGSGAEQFKTAVATLTAPISTDHVNPITKASSKYKKQVKIAAKKHTKKKKPSPADSSFIRDPMQDAFCYLLTYIYIPSGR